MKKYQLKYNNGTELIILRKSDILYEILWSIIYNTTILRPYKELSKFSVWMDGKVLE